MLKIKIYIIKKMIFKKEKFKKVVIKDLNDEKTKISKNKFFFYIIIIIPFLSFIIIILLYLFLIHKNNLSSSNFGIKIIDKDYKVNDSTDENTYFKIIKDFIYINYNGTFLYDIKKFKKNENPKISVIITIHNAQAFIKSALRCVQNQDFQDIEIIMVEDDSADDSVKIIKEFMKEDPRIRLIYNDREKGNRGYLYTIINGVLNAKGKYVMILDVDDLFSVENVLSSLYTEIEKYGLDILGFSSTQGILDMSTHKYTHTNFHNYFETSIFNQPELSESIYNKNEKGNVIGQRCVIWGYIIKTDFFIKVIKEIDDKFFNIIFSKRGDCFLFFILSKRAKTLKYIKKLFYVTVQKKISGNSFENYFTSEKKKKRKKNNCQSLLGYIEFVVTKSNDDVKLASFLIENRFLKNDCIRRDYVRDQVISICKVVLDNKFIENRLKDKINSLLKSMNENKY